MSYRIEEIEGIGPAYGSKLEGIGIVLTNHLLKTCGTARGRRQVAAASGISEAQLLKWANMADLMRIKGVGRQFSELLEAAGVDTVKELRQRNADNLAAKMREVNEAKRLTRTVPSPYQVKGWVEQAQKLDPAISH
ncbi:MAG: DUF4332 domain-containing protein [Rhodospirillales bacterium]|jgi:predicted flap endonuclease-1-like 5' DNA nuclease|nr:DUF4332 domain-containing protein [Rhodospirillales bacterium]